MKRFSLGTYSAFALSFLALVLPHIAFGASFLPIVAQPGTECYCIGSAPDYGCVMQIIQNVISAAIQLGVILCVAYIGYAGFTFMLAGGNPQALSASKTRLLNAVLGIAVILSAWIIVDSALKTIYKPEASYLTVNFGPWNKLLAPGPGSNCIQVNTEPDTLAVGTVTFSLTTSGGNNAAPGGGSNGPLPTGGTGACDASLVSQGAAAGGYPLSNGASAALACVAHYESGCGANNQNYNWGKGSSAYGPFQILLGNNGDAFNNNACDAAVGYAPGTSLNCKAGFSGGNPIAGSPVVELCKRAASNLSCSAAAISKLTNRGNKSLLLQAYGSSAKDTACINQKYGS